MHTELERSFADRLLRWFEHHGRHGLPWQDERTPYRVWVSEIMLQQTRVETVIPYFNAFMQRFPSLTTLAEAPIDAVLQHWSGLGYYARARNLHRTARMVADEFNGELPRTREELVKLPGIGRSTAAAILAQAHGQREAILDGNCKRVFARYMRIRGWPGNPKVQEKLWAVAEQLLPEDQLADYTQALMDLGATLCTRRHARCGECPVADSCAARMLGLVDALPEPRPTRPLPLRSRWAALVQSPQGMLLEKRPPSGIWGGLYSLPEHEDPESLLSEILTRFPDAKRTASGEQTIHHVFSHYRLQLHLIVFALRSDRNPTTEVINTGNRVMDAAMDSAADSLMDGDRTIWYKPRTQEQIGLPAPIARFLEDFWSRQNG